MDPAAGPGLDPTEGRPSGTVRGQYYLLSPAFAKPGDIVRLAVTKSLTLAITFALLQVELSYLACVLFVKRPFRWYHFVTLTFDLPQCQICWGVGDHNSLNLLVFIPFHLWTIREFKTYRITEDRQELCNQMYKFLNSKTAASQSLDRSLNSVNI